MKTRKKQAGLALGAVLLMIPGRWAAAAEPAPVQDSTAPVHPLPGPGDEIYRPEAPPEEEDEEGPDEALARLLYLPPDLFYREVGRPDLADSVHERHAFKFGARALGGLGLGVGVLWWLFANMADTLLIDCSQPSPDPVCNKTHWGPDLLMAGSLAVLVTGFIVDEDPLNWGQRYDLAIKSVGTARLSNLSLAPRVDRDGGGLMLAGRF
jgi:hypothetical protein